MPSKQQQPRKKHPKLTRNRNVNEHLTFCAMHTRAANDTRLSNAKRRAHKDAAAMHMSHALHHYRIFH